MKKFFRSLFLMIPIVTPLGLMNQETQTSNEFRKIPWEKLDENAMDLIGNEWMLVGAGNMEKGFNMMTASWGGLGYLWNKPVSFIFVRPQRYTHTFTEREDYYTLTFFEEQHRSILQKMGSVSGRNFDKMKESGLTPFTTDNGSIGFKEARLIIECRKLYQNSIQEGGFKDSTLAQKMYPGKDFHTMYVGEITNIWIRER
jgi:flavin reductase (DIM6/NTAB) family NADH-FMN oxidoreductase RutF